MDFVSPHNDRLERETIHHRRAFSRWTALVRKASFPSVPKAGAPSVTPFSGSTLSPAMTETPPEPVERALEDHDAFEPVGTDSDTSDTPYELTTTVFETAVTATDADGSRDGTIHVTITVPTLDAAVANEPVADVVEDGWFETFERRLEDTFGVTNLRTHEEPVVERDEQEVRVHLEYVTWDADEGVADAKTLVEYVEGTYAQGIIPGYEYRGPAGELLENAQQRGQRAANEEGSENGSGAPL